MPEPHRPLVATPLITGPATAAPVTTAPLITAPLITAAMCAAGRSFGDVRLSPDGATVAFVASGGGRTVLATVPSAGGPEVVVTTEPAPRRGTGVVDWTPDGLALVYVGADGGLYHQPITGGPARRLAHTTHAGAPAVSPDGTRVAYVVDRRDVAVAWLAAEGPWPVRVSGPADFAADPSWSADSQRVAWHTWDVPAMPWDASSVAVAAAAVAGSLEDPRVVDVPPPSSVGQPRFAPTGSALGFLCDAGGWLNLWWTGGGSVVPLVPDDHEHGNPTWGLGQRTWVWSPDGGQVAFARNEEGFGRLCVVEVGKGTIVELDRGVFSSLSWAGGRLAALRSGSRTPDQIVVYALGAGAAVAETRSSRVTVARGPVAGFEAAGLAEPEVVSWDGEDRPGVGSVVHGRLYRAARPSPVAPAGGLAGSVVAGSVGSLAGGSAGSVVAGSAGSLAGGSVGSVVAGSAGSLAGGSVGAVVAGSPAPLIVWVHGGPTDQNQVRFHARSAYFLDRGWNVLQVDPRGSTGWGRAYAQALAGEWGRLDVEDLAAGIRAAGRCGWGDPRRVVIMGGSSGGLAVLAVLGRHPGLCAAGVDLYGVTDLVELDETTHRYEAHYQASLVGPRPGAAGAYRERSPLAYAGRIRDPLLVFHGTEDRVVGIGQSEDLVAAVRRSGTAVEYHRFEGEGHGWSQPANVVRELELIDAFLTRHVLRDVDPSPDPLAEGVS